jgi:8-oxo-dGTP pyrophosphatase MutT (NUDIX family)
MEKEIDESNPWKVIDTTQAYESPWIKVTHSNVLNPSGNPGTYSVVHFKKYAIGIIPLDEQYNTWLVGQYRFPMQQYSWEIPEGGGDKENTPLESAQRELLEECGIVAGDWQLIQQMQLSNSATDEVAFIYTAKQLSYSQAMPDENEQLVIRKLPFDEVYQMVCDGRITDSLSVAGILKVKLLMLDGRC